MREVYRGENVTYIQIRAISFPNIIYTVPEASGLDGRGRCLLFLLSPDVSLAAASHIFRGDFAVVDVIFAVRTLTEEGDNISLSHPAWKLNFKN